MASHTELVTHEKEEQNEQKGRQERDREESEVTRTYSLSLRPGQPRERVEGPQDGSPGSVWAAEAKAG